MKEKITFIIKLVLQMIKIILFKIFRIFKIKSMKFHEREISVGRRKIRLVFGGCRRFVSCPQARISWGGKPVVGGGHDHLNLDFNNSRRDVRISMLEEFERPLVSKRGAQIIICTLQSREDCSDIWSIGLNSQIRYINSHRHPWNSLKKLDAWLCWTILIEPDQCWSNLLIEIGYPK